ncbi:MAG TPA: hypothetical protein VH743_19020 [Beijerinckiaceae bacterium]
MVVDDKELDNRGWQTVDLSTPLSVSSVLADARGLRRGKWTSSTSLSLRWRSMVERGASACRSARKTQALARRVPERDIVYVGRGPAPLAAAAEGGAARDGDVLRQFLFLLALGAVMAGSFYLGQTWTKQNVIVVPAPSTFRSVIT